jgi:peroxiredoxin
MAFRTFQPGETAPWFHASSNVNPRFAFDTMAGRYVVLTFFGGAADPQAQTLFQTLQSVRYLLDDQVACLFAISADPADEGQLPDQLPGIRFFYDSDLAISKLYGTVDDAAPDRRAYERRTFVLDERLRIVRVIEWHADPIVHVQQLVDALTALPVLEPPRNANVQAPILVVPRVFEPAFCRTLIDYYTQRGGRESGFMREVQGKTVEVLDFSHKRRRDEELDNEELRRGCMVRIHDRLVPEIKKAFQFHATRIERYIVGCYEAEVGAHFRAHRDNTTKGTAHRRFAVSLNLNTGEYDGGWLRFPEFGQQLYSAPAGGAVVFSCSLLHEATPVTRGKRFAFLPFLYDDAAARIREQNLQFLG